MRSTPCLPAVQGESLSGLDLSGTTHTNIGIYTDRRTITGMMGGRKRTIGEATMSG